MGFFEEFKSFAVKGNAVDMAVGLVVGAGFGKIVSSLVEDVIMPPLGLLIGGVDFSQLVVVLKSAGPNSPAVLWKYGRFIQMVFDFTIVAFAMFAVIKMMNAIKSAHSNAAPPLPASKEEVLLGEIRDILKAETAPRARCEMKSL